MKRSYRQKLTLSFLAIFTILTIGIVIFEQSRGRRYKTEALIERLDGYSDIVYSYNHLPDSIATKEMLLSLLPTNIRLTLISPDGSVIYDNLFSNPSVLENHADRPEVLAAREHGSGTFIRTSASTTTPYLYYTKYYGEGFVRVALPYDIQVQHFLKPDNGFLYFILLIFLIGFMLIATVGNHFGSSIRKLRDFSAAASSGAEDLQVPHFSRDELGEIGNVIATEYRKLHQHEKELTRQKDKLLQHVQSSAEGICFFNPDGSTAFYNGLFLQYLNLLDAGDLAGRDLLSHRHFAPAREFLLGNSDESYFETTMSGNGRDFILRLNRFDDNSFEIVLTDVTLQEKTSRLKKEMTGNIAHELRTPVTSIRGYLETVLDSKLDAEQERKFLERAYNQTLALSELIRDMGLLTKIEDNPDTYDFQPVDLALIVEKTSFELEKGLKENGVNIENKLPSGFTVKGNENLIYTILRNLMDNVIWHAGEKVNVEIREIERRDGFSYISFSDNGKGIVEEKDLNRLFERFFRIDEGRTRGNGGSGLGLSIVKNSVKLHGGTIVVRNRAKGGLEFIFSLPVE